MTIIQVNRLNDKNIDRSTSTEAVLLRFGANHALKMAVGVGMENLVDKENWFKTQKHMTRRLEQKNKTWFTFKINNCTSNNTDCILTKLQINPNSRRNTGN